MHWCPNQGVSLLHAQCSWDILWIHCNPDQNKVINEDQLVTVNQLVFPVRDGSKYYHIRKLGKTLYYPNSPWGTLFLRVYGRKYGKSVLQEALGWLRLFYSEHYLIVNIDTLRNKLKNLGCPTWSLGVYMLVILLIKELWLSNFFLFYINYVRKQSCVSFSLSLYLRFVAMRAQNISHFSAPEFWYIWGALLILLTSNIDRLTRSATAKITTEHKQPQKWTLIWLQTQSNIVLSMLHKEWQSHFNFLYFTHSFSSLRVPFPSTRVCVCVTVVWNLISFFPLQY